MRFVRAHSAPSAAIDQLGRWREPVCPLTVGLKPSFDKLVSRRISRIAEQVGAPTRGAGKPCSVNVEVIFTPHAQGLLDHLARRYPWLVGFPTAAHPPRFRGPIESWYLTATRPSESWTPPESVNVAANPGGGGLYSRLSDDAEQVAGLPGGAEIDVPGAGAPSGAVSGWLTAGLESEFAYVLIIVDAHQVEGYSLGAVSDYLAMLSLTHVTPPETCNALPSITDLLAPRCTEDPKPSKLTAEDAAYLKALYSSSLEMNLNIEEGEVRDRMVRAIAGG